MQPIIDVSYCRLSPVAVFLWSLLTRGYLDVCMFLQNCMNIKDAVESLQILSIAASPGDLDIRRLVC